jgi:hypothetical protein
MPAGWTKICGDKVPAWPELAVPLKPVALASASDVANPWALVPVTVQLTEADSLLVPVVAPTPVNQLLELSVRAPERPCAAAPLKSAERLIKPLAALPEAAAPVAIVALAVVLAPDA